MTEVPFSGCPVWFICKEPKTDIQAYRNIHWFYNYMHTSSHTQALPLSSIWILSHIPLKVNYKCYTPLCFLSHCQAPLTYRSCKLQ